jgi:hypothetical protein
VVQHDRDDQQQHEDEDDRQAHAETAREPGHERPARLLTGVFITHRYPR